VGSGIDLGGPDGQYQKGREPDVTTALEALFIV